VKLGDDRRRIGWIGIQPDGSVSVGLNDRTFIARDSESRQFVWSAFNRRTVQYLVPDEGTPVKGVRNPHLTFHPPGWFQLGVTKGKKPFQGIGDLQVMLSQDGIVPWVRFVSRSFSRIKSAAEVRNPQRTQSIEIVVTSPECSIGLGVDFLRPDFGAPVHPSEHIHRQIIKCANYNLLVFAEVLPAQRPTLSWYHQY